MVYQSSPIVRNKLQESPVGAAGTQNQVLVVRDAPHTLDDAHLTETCSDDPNEKLLTKGSEKEDSAKEIRTVENKTVSSPKRESGSVEDNIPEDENINHDDDVTLKLLDKASDGEEVSITHNTSEAELKERLDQPDETNIWIWILNMLTSFWATCKSLIRVCWILSCHYIVYR